MATVSVFAIGRLLYYIDGRKSLLYQTALRAPDSLEWVWTVWGTRSLPMFLCLYLDVEHRTIVHCRFNPLFSELALDGSKRTITWQLFGKLAGLLLDTKTGVDIRRFYASLRLPITASDLPKSKYARSNELMGRAKKIRSRRLPEWSLMIAEQEEVLPKRLYYTCCNPYHTTMNEAVNKDNISIDMIDGATVDREDRIVCRVCAVNIQQHPTLTYLIGVLTVSLGSTLPHLPWQSLIDALTILNTITMDDIGTLLYDSRSFFHTELSYTTDPLIGLGQRKWDRMQLLHDHMENDPVLHATQLHLISDSSHPRTLRPHITAVIHGLNTLDVFGVVRLTESRVLKQESLWSRLMDALTVVDAVDPESKRNGIYIRSDLKPALKRCYTALQLLGETCSFVCVSLFHYAARQRLFQPLTGERVTAYIHVRPDQMDLDITASTFVKIYTVSAFLAAMHRTPSSSTTVVVVWPAHACTAVELADVLELCAIKQYHVRLAGHLYLAGPDNCLFTQLAHLTGMRVWPLTTPIKHAYSVLDKLHSGLFAPLEHATHGIPCPMLAEGANVWVVARVLYKAQVTAHWKLTPEVALVPLYRYTADSKLLLHKRAILEDPIASNRELWTLTTTTIQCYVYPPQLNLIAPSFWIE